MAAMFERRWARVWIWLALGCAAGCLSNRSVLAQSSSTAAVEQLSADGQNALAAGNYQAAEQAFEKLRKLEPAVAEVHANLGLIYFQQGKFEEAVPALRQALKLKPSLT